MGSIPITRSSLELGCMNIAHIAQSAEHFLGKEEVIGSIPIMGSRILMNFLGIFFKLKN